MATLPLEYVPYSCLMRLVWYSLAYMCGIHLHTCVVFTLALCSTVDMSLMWLLYMLIGCVCFPLSGEFGTVYKGTWNERKPPVPIAVKTLKVAMCVCVCVSICVCVCMCVVVIVHIHVCVCVLCCVLTILCFHEACIHV